MKLKILVFDKNVLLHYISFDSKFTLRGFNILRNIFYLVMNAALPVFLVMVVGYILKQKKVVDEPFIKTLNSFNYKITLPVLLFQDISQSDFYAVWDTRYVLFCFFATLISIAVIWGLTSLLYKNKDALGEFVQASYRSSAAVLGIALIQNIYGNSGMAPLMIIGSVPLYNAAAVLVLSFTGPNRKPFTFASAKKSLLDIITNPIILGILLGMVASILPLSFPTIINKTLQSIAALATPLALLGLGAGFEGRKALKLLKPTLISSFIKLLALPTIFVPFAIVLGFRKEMLVAF